MCAFLILALLGSVSVTNAGEISLHEWGVIVYGTDGTSAVGGSGGPWFNPDQMVAKAPVIYMYGRPFTGNITVASLGRIFDTYPRLDVEAGPGALFDGLGSCVRWTDITASTPSDPEVPVSWSNAFDVTTPGFQWALPMWRQPQAMLLERADGFLDRFLYYEVDLSGTAFPIPLVGLAPGDTPAGEMVSESIMLIHRAGYDDMTFELLPGGDLSMAGRTAPFIYSCEEVLGILNRWAGGILTEEEIAAMWSTWEPYVMYGDWEGGDLAIFPIPIPLVERISAISVSNDQDIPVSFHRFFLGMKALPRP